MSNEWVKVELYGANNDGNPRRYVIADGLSVSKGQLLELVSLRTASAALYRINPVAWAGVALEEHIAGQGVTSISCLTDGVFEAKIASEAITAGMPVTGYSNNYVISSWGLCIPASGGIIGYALETGAAMDTINVRLQL